MPTEYTVVGEHREDATQLLVMGEDGRYYSYVPAREQISPIDLDDTWLIIAAPALERLEWDAPPATSASQETPA